MLAEVTAVSEDIDTPFWIKASWTGIDGEHPGLIRPRPGSWCFMPAVGAFVEIEAIPGRTGEYWWFGRAIAAADLPPEAKAAYPELAAMLSKTGRFYIIMDDRRGAKGALRLHAGSDTFILATEGKVEIVLGGTKTPAAKATLKSDGSITLEGKTAPGHATAKATLQPDGKILLEGEQILLGDPTAFQGAAREGDAVRLGPAFSSWCTSVGAGLTVPVPWPPPGYPPEFGGAPVGAIVDGSPKVKVI